MKLKLRSGAAIALGLTVSASVAAQAEPYDIGIFFDQNGVVAEGEVEANTAPLTLYFMILNLEESLTGFVTTLSIVGPRSDEWVIERGEHEPPGGLLDLDPYPDGFEVGFRYCQGGPGENLLIETYTLSYIGAGEAPQNTLLCAGPSSYHLSNFYGQMLIQECSEAYGGSGEILPAGLAQHSLCRPEVPNGCAIVNPSAPGCVVGAREASWSALKSKF